MESEIAMDEVGPNQIYSMMPTEIVEEESNRLTTEPHDFQNDSVFLTNSDLYNDPDSVSIKNHVDS